MTEETQKVEKEDLTELTEREKIERITNMASALYSINQDLESISTRDSYKTHRKIIVEVAYSLMISASKRIQDLSDLELSQRSEIESGEWEQDDEIRQMIEELRE